jgi:hypothetical protein
MPSIVTVNVTQTVGATPATLQQSGALISQGATTTTPGTATLFTQASDLTAILTGAKALTSVTLSGGTATAVCSAAHGFTLGDTLLITISGVTPAGYNGTFTATVTTTTAFTYPLSGSLSTGSGGVYTPEDVAELNAMVNTFFAQGSGLSTYVLELGPGNASDGVTALTAYITANPNSSYTAGAAGYFYAYLVPRTWDAAPSFLSMVANYESLTSRVYFFVTTTLASYTSYTNLMKCVVPLIESPTYGVYSANAITAGSVASSVATVTTTTAHGVAPGNWFTVSGCTPTGYNGTFLALPGTSGTSLVYAVPSSLTVSMSGFGTLQASLYGNAGVPSTEFSCAAAFFNFLNYSPSSANLVAPFAFKFLYGVTPFPTRGNNALLTTLKAANINVVGTGAEGGISNTILLWGTTADGHDATYWYSVDWMQINSDLAISNAVINGSNNGRNPIYYDQNGINRLQAVAQGVVQRGISYGLVLANVTNPPTVTAVPFTTYVTTNPTDYPAGIYKGLAVTFTPQRGFIAITFNVNVSSFPAGG